LKNVMIFTEELEYALNESIITSEFSFSYFLTSIRALFSDKTSLTVSVVS
jgi:hypothetical protein